MDLSKTREIVCGAPEGVDAMVLLEKANEAASKGLLHFCRDDLRLATLAELIGFFRPDLELIKLPAWDCVPYDRISPHPDIAAQRIESLYQLANKENRKSNKPWIVLTTVSAVLQRIPKAERIGEGVRTIKVNQHIDLEEISSYLVHIGYVHTELVMEAGEYARRGGMIDLFPPGEVRPLRLDLFGDQVESLRTFDPITQRTIEDCGVVVIKPMGEVVLSGESITRFRSSYRELFGSVLDGDSLYEAVSKGQRFAGMEHWLPLFHDGLDTILDYLPESVISIDPQTDEAVNARYDLIGDYFSARKAREKVSKGKTGKSFAINEMIYHPVSPDLLYLRKGELEEKLERYSVIELSPYAPADLALESHDAGGRLGRRFSDVRAGPNSNLYAEAAAHLEVLGRSKLRVILAVVTDGSGARLSKVLSEHGVKGLVPVGSWNEAQGVKESEIALIPLSLRRGFITDHMAVVTEQDILGERLVRSRGKRSKAEYFIADAVQLGDGDLLVHSEHGIGRYTSLDTLDVGGAPHDCLKLVYAGEDKLYVPVENIDVLSRFGPAQSGAQLDKLGGSAWQARKSRLKKRIREMAEELIRIAAVRELKDAEQFVPEEGLYDEFCGRFPFAETHDQLLAIGDVLEDLAKGQPMDRLICGDVGFGKTEVALRAAFLVAMTGGQVAVVVPTTLLARQHTATFIERFAGFPIKIAQLSRLVTPAAASRVRSALRSGGIDIVIGTHALLARSVEFANLTLLVVDEEQHFGVAHKERLKQLKEDVHVLVLTATPIPRTLQMALSGVKEMSLITTPPIDRLAVRTFILPFDPVVIREAILRERFRGGQCFYVCPRVKDITEVSGLLRKLVPEAILAVAHGQMPTNALEEVMSSFSAGRIDVLITTNIIESGLDMPTVNTIVIHRSDLFGLSQLYQLRGRVGRSKVRAYAYLTIPLDRKLTSTAEKRLDVMQTLDSLGAGFSLASHDLDIRGAGNLLGDEQSGHIKEVGVELYQHLLEEAVAAARSGEGVGPETVDDFSPQIYTGTPVLIPDTYVKDLGLRLNLYRRAGTFTKREEIDAFAAELIDRFGPLPEEVSNFLDTVAVKVLCKLAHVEKVEAGPKGAVLTLRKNQFPNPVGLVSYIHERADSIKVRADHRVVVTRNWEDVEVRMRGIQKVLRELASTAAEANP